MAYASVRFVSPRHAVLLSVLLTLGASPLLAQVAGPRLMFTDIESGPGTGGQNNLGAFISIYGEGFGATQGSSAVTIGGQPVASVTSWGQDNAPRSLDRIVVQPGPGAVSGNIVVTMGGQASNGLPFTVRAGNIYFVDQAGGNDANPGTFAQPWATIWRPRQTMVAGDIVYVIGGTFSQLDPDWPGWDALLMLDTSFGASGTAAAPIAYLGYPGNPPLLENILARRGVYLNQDSGPLSYIVIGNMRFGLMEDAINVIGVGQRIVGNDLSNGGVGNKIGVFGDTSAIRILGNRLVSNGTPTTKYYCIYVQGFGVNSDVEVGWNEMRNQYGRSLQVFGHVDGDRVENLRIHDNVMVGADLNNLLLGGSDGNNEILGTVTVTGNIIAGSTAEGLRVNDPQGTLVIENNTLVGNGLAQVYLERAGAGLITLRDNIVVAQAGQQYYQFDVGSSSASFVPAHNLVFGAGPCDPWDTGCINQDPLFAGASDYRLQPGSPAIDAGVATTVARDHDGIPRPQGAAWDIGAHERAAASVMKGDIDRDGYPDLVFRSNVNGAQNKVWIMNGVARASEAAITPDAASADWKIRGVDDFDADNRNDLVFWNQATGNVQFWLMNGTTRVGTPVPLSGGAVLPTNWDLAATADFNHDARPDIVWRNFTSQKIVIWTMNGSAKLGNIIPTPDQAVDGNWMVVAALDYTADRNPDFLWYNQNSGKIVTWYMNASVVRTSGQFTTPANAGDANWRVVASSDYSRDYVPGTPPIGSPDIVWRNETSGNQVVWHMDFASTRVYGQFTSPAANTQALDWTIVGPR